MPKLRLKKWQISLQCLFVACTESAKPHSIWGLNKCSMNFVLTEQRPYYYNQSFRSNVSQANVGSAKPPYSLEHSINDLESRQVLTEINSSTSPKNRKPYVSSLYLFYKQRQPNDSECQFSKLLTR